VGTTLLVTDELKQEKYNEEEKKRMPPHLPHPQTMKSSNVSHFASSTELILIIKKN
jgi:hypothetical protein